MDEIAELRATIAQLSARLNDLESRTAAPAAATPRGPVSRRGLLAAAAAGAGLIAGGVTRAAPASAAPGDHVVLGATNDGGGQITTITSATGLNSAPLGVVNPNPNLNSIGIYGQLGAQSGLFNGAAYQRAAVIGDSREQVGVAAFSLNNPAIYAQANGYPAVYAKSGADGVWVDAQRKGVQVSTVEDTAVEAYSEQGYGVVAHGKKAPIVLVPSTRAGAPTVGRHAVGELFVDKAGALFLCVKAGSPGT